MVKCIKKYKLNSPYDLQDIWRNSYDGKDGRAHYEFYCEACDKIHTWVDSEWNVPNPHEPEWLED